MVTKREGGNGCEGGEHVERTRTMTIMRESTKCEILDGHTCVVPMHNMGRIEEDAHLSLEAEWTS